MQSGRGGEGGQATIEWVGLLLGVALMLGVVAAGGREAAKGESATELGEAVAQRITCAARDACGSRGTGGLRGSDGGRPLGRPPDRTLRAPPSERRRQSAKSGVLTGVGGVAKRAWVVCLGYRRWQYEVRHPRTPRQGVPVRDTIRMVNDCVNPLSFFFG